MRSVLKVSSHFEYLDNWSHGLDVIWQPVSCEAPFSEFLYCVTIGFTNLLPFNGDFSFGKSQQSQGAKSGL